MRTKVFCILLVVFATGCPFSASKDNGKDMIDVATRGEDAGHRQTNSIQEKQEIQSITTEAEEP